MDHTALRELFARDAFAKACGLTLETVADGVAVCSVQLAPQHLNGLGSAQGGLVYTLADFAFAVACNSARFGSVTLDGGIHYLKAPRAGRLTATARPDSVGKAVAVYRVEVRDEAGDLVAVASFTGFAKGTARDA